MSEAASTQRPWFVGTMNDALFILDKPPRPAPVDAINPNVGKDTRVIAKLAENDRRADADARLIAAAPDLAYAALAQEEAEDFNANCPECEGEGDWATCEPCSGRFGHAIDLRRAALAKVRGNGEPT